VLAHDTSGSEGQARLELNFPRRASGAEYLPKVRDTEVRANALAL